MKAAICTLFEGHYHFGVATLSNSLYKNGFRGTIYVGYRGALPEWALKGKKVILGKWDKAIVLCPIDGIEMVFVPLTTTYSLTNYKPDFMLELWEGVAQDEEALFYFDPDIVVDESWACFEEWVKCGVAVCEDVNSPLQEFHPRRVGWREYFAKYDLDLSFKNQIYVNGGFIGLLKKDISFLIIWRQIQENMADDIGGLEKSIFSDATIVGTITERKGFQIFDKSDQDALNAAIETYKGVISFIGKEGMGFGAGNIAMYHALGSPKPWKANHFLRAVHAKPPRKEDVAYWMHTEAPILAHSRFESRRKILSIKLAKLIGRFYNVN
ncbi:hypothetical protein [Flavobacterium sp. 7A]|uniref:hypothetical protein n=1 Tax=Flavobacterium sp. 7A TaxID=2940571 RepID=UPI0022277A9D|nr:hypothetical protein [Flavobacterium sp. 7A]MCW2118492.1 hypothetical protein [Flavobacterium sp. 7A]